ncbi:M1 family metallopeptidase [Nocardioides sp. CER19]|uniref:M1 family metallopeptidase n=1 Tax=Nocardioides sp. CER19 TaxID=3038538 RepID=UPI002449DD9F|nr:M1 family metallopeptidase [Nocardioides sp. CER19]MDH2413159.1 M1 family metallopeptidase [Nocardioides sp. CER19]
MRRVVVAALAVALVPGLAGLAGCDGGSDRSGQRSGTHSVVTANPDPAAYADARSTPVEDSVYPEVGDPGVDALHYALDVSWDPEAKVLTGHEQLLFRATTTADHVQLDLAAEMRPTAVTLDGRRVRFTHPGKDLVVQQDVVADHAYTLVLDYSGTPTPTPAPTNRPDTETLGLTVEPDGGLWTMQEPYGAFTWYAVNDQPSDKARYDVSVDAPSPMVGVSNGKLTHRSTDDGRTETSWHLDEPAAAYLVTLAVGRYQETTATSSSGVPISYWTPVGDTELLRNLQRAPALLDWLEKRLGPYPFDSLGFVIVDSSSGMETQTMITLGNDPETVGPDVLVHEMAHQWYGDEVTPSDWRDVWMNEGMAMYLQTTWQDEDWKLPPGDSLSSWAGEERRARRADGPPGNYKRDRFAELNVYFGPAFMWQRLRTMIGDDAFWSMVRAWPAARAERSTGRDDYLRWIEQRTGRDLSSFFQQWLMSPTTPR